MSSLVQVKYLPKEYFDYNPNGKTYFKVATSQDCGLLYIQEVGIMSNEDIKQCGNDALNVYISGGITFDVHRTSKGLHKSVKSCEKELRKLIKEQN